jgi:hypothetical protein
LTELPQLIRQIATGSSSQKRRAWSELFDAGAFWNSCREAARNPPALNELATAYGELSGTWERRPIRQLLEDEDADEDLEMVIGAASRTLAAAGVAAAAIAPRPDPRQLIWWAERAIGGIPTGATLLDPPADASSGEALIRHCFRSLHSRAPDRAALAAAQDTAISLLHGTRDKEGRSPARRLRAPVLLARGSDGFLAWLWLERLPGGFGQFFQAPDTRFDPLRRDLREAVDAAHRYINGVTPLAKDEDVRWWLSSLPGSRTGAAAMVSGASLQGAAAVGLILLLEEHPYNPTFAVSATLQGEGALGGVIGFSGPAPKLRAALRLRSASGPATVVVGPPNQPSETMAAEWEARGVRIAVAATVWEAAQQIRESAAEPSPGLIASVAAFAPKQPAPASVVSEPSARPYPAPQTMLSPPAGVLPLDSQFYVVRPTDGQLASAIDRQDSIVRIKGARQMGKTSLLARGLQQARQAGATVVLTDCRMFNAVHLESADTFLNTVARWFIRNLKLETRLEDVWDPLQGPNWNFRDFLLGEVLTRLNTPLVWALDDVDRLFSCTFGSEIFGLFRSWHNERALDPAVPWSRLTIAMAHATDAHLFITEPHLSPFNVGARVTMEDLTRAEVTDLNERYGRPLQSEGEVDAYCQLFGGQPYLTHRGLYEMATQPIGLRALAAGAQSGEGIFSEHLGRLVLMLSENRELCEAVRSVMRGGPCPSNDSYQRLWSAGVFTGGSAREARLRCELYGRYLEQHLP